MSGGGGRVNPCRIVGKPLVLIWCIQTRIDVNLDAFETQQKTHSGYRAVAVGVTMVVPRLQETIWKSKETHKMA